MQIAVACGRVKPNQILVDANIKYAVSVYPDSCGYRRDLGA